jgi:hypothetical protein
MITTTLKTTLDSKTKTTCEPTISSTTTKQSFKTTKETNCESDGKNRVFLLKQLYREIV